VVVTLTPAEIEVWSARFEVRIADAIMTGPGEPAREALRPLAAAGRARRPGGRLSLDLRDPRQVGRKPKALVRAKSALRSAGARLAADHTRSTSSSFWSTSDQRPLAALP
jgi:hypothetical protein